ncbi:MAG: 1,6-anhydro-N-acetylmuramyl-L-alanine amidase AmpD [Sulfuritalea sp.]|nr:1,6-anhydro-N-acetylmuramyl-L-alanine amidase AmpD [Sulfuritalea sp.]
MTHVSQAADDAEWWPQARRVPSPNFDERPENASIELIVIHAISLPPDEFGSQDIIRLFTNKLDPQEHPYFREIQDMRVSAHFLVRRDGELIQFVPCARRAWHAGVSTWRGRENCNDFSIGIELEGCDRLPFEDVQYRVLNRLLAELRHRYQIDAVVGHSDVAPGRKTDPGPCFDWHRIRGAGG